MSPTKTSISEAKSGAPELKVECFAMTRVPLFVT
jgi:hypothetical protein